MLSHAVILEAEKGPGDSELRLPLWAQPASGSVQERYRDVTESDNLLHSKTMNFNPPEPTLPLSKPGYQPHPKSWGNLDNIFSSPPTSTSCADSVTISLRPSLSLAHETHGSWWVEGTTPHPQETHLRVRGKSNKVVTAIKLHLVKHGCLDASTYFV